MARLKSWYPSLKRYTDNRILLVCLAALLLASCGTLRTAQSPARSLDSAAEAAPTASREFRGEYEEALGMMRERRYDQAGVRLVGMTRSYPRLAGPYINLGIVYLHLGRDKEAETALIAATDINPGSAVAHNLLGVIYREEGRFDEARRAYQRALEIDPAYADAHLNLGVLFDLYLQQPSEALAHYERYRILKPADAARVDPWIADLVRTHARTGERNGS